MRSAPEEKGETMRDKLSELLSECLCFGYDDITGTDYVKVPDTADRLIESGATIPVRCKECKYLYDELDDYCCTSHRGLVRICENSFCSYGERRTDD